MKSTLIYGVAISMMMGVCYGELCGHEGPRPTIVKTTLIHCEVPCGIYTDQLRFEQMLEDTHTIAKAIEQINHFSTELQGPPTGKDINQVVRWVTTKDAHASNIQQIVSQYFMTQRIKPDHERYDAQIKSAHAVMIAAMKCKQDADPQTADTLNQAIKNLYTAYEGKQPGEEETEGHGHDHTEGEHSHD